MIKLGIIIGLGIFFVLLMVLIDLNQSIKYMNISLDEQNAILEEQNQILNK